MLTSFAARLTNSQRDRLLISLHTRRESPETFSVGWIVAMSDDVYILATVDEIGRRDSYQFGFIDDIYKITANGDYLQAIGEMMMSYVESETMTLPEPSLAGVFVWAIHSKSLISIQDRLGVESFVFVTEFDKESFAMQAYNSMGAYDGDVSMLIQDIFRVEFGGPALKGLSNLILDSRQAAPSSRKGIVGPHE